MIKCNTLSLMARCMTPIQRMVVSHDGTLQDLLSAYFGHPVEVKVCDQNESKSNIIRNSVLYIDDGLHGVDVCMATSVIPTTSTLLQNTEFVDRIRERKYGIGFILNELGIKTRRELSDVHIVDNMFRRVYRIYDEASEIDVIITETFPPHYYTCCRELPSR